MFQKGFLFVGLLLTVAFPLAGQTPLIETSSEDSSYVAVFQFSPDSKTIVSYTLGGTLLTWDLTSRKLLRSQQAKAEHATFDPQGNLLSVVLDNKGTRLMDVVANKEMKLLENAYLYHTSKFAISRDVKTFAAERGSSEVKLWDLTSGKEKLTIKRPEPGDSIPDAYLSALLFSPDGTTLAGLSRSITLWSASTGKQLRSLEIEGGLARLGFTPDGKVICVSGFQNMQPPFIKCFSVLSGRQVLSVPADETSPFAFNPDGTMLATVRPDPDRGIFLINPATGKVISKITVSMDIDAFHSFTQMSFSPNGKLLAIGSTKGLVLLDPVARKELFTLAQTSAGPPAKPSTSPSPE